VRRSKTLEAENTKLKKRYAERTRVHEALKNALVKKL
jgi:hypothetical protein